MAYGSKTWWGQQFLEALERSMDYGRLSRGRSYSSTERLIEFEIRDGTIIGRLKGNINPYFDVYETPYYKVSVQLTHFSEANWRRVLERLGRNANWVTHFVIGEVPPNIDDALGELGISLLPRSSRDIKSKCSCPDWASPCKHVAGVYHHVANLLDRDPLLLFELRGLPRRKLLEAAAKTDFGKALAAESEPLSEPEAIPGEPLFPEVLHSQAEVDPSDTRRFWLGKPIPQDARANVPPTVSVLPMRRVGDYPEFWSRNISFLETMGKVYEHIAKGLPEKHLKGESLLNAQ